MEATTLASFIPMKLFGNATALEKDLRVSLGEPEEEQELTSRLKTAHHG